jgi:Ca-activated chloride channel family protein
MRVAGTRLAFAALILATMAAASSSPVAAGQSAGQPVFRAAVDLVSVAAVVRDKRGRVMRSLTREDFELIDAGQRRPFVDFRSAADAPASVMLLVDGSGSMAAGSHAARRVSELLLQQLAPHRDEAALMSFDTRLLTVRDFTTDFDRIRRGFRELDAFGLSSIYDAIAGTAGVVADRVGKRRAIVVLTDGSDNASVYTAKAVASIASAIDVPVYIFAVGHDVPRADGRGRRVEPRAMPLTELANATGGEFFYAAEPADQDAAVARVIDDLRHQYLIAFEPSTFGGLRRIEIRTRQSDLRVSSRQWYTAAVPQ